MPEPAFFETLYAQRAIRRFKPDVVPSEVIERIIEAATHAPSGGNRQPWAFVVVTDPAKKARIAEWYHEGWVAMYASDPNRPRNAVYRSAEYLAEHMAETPVLIFPCISAGGGRAPSFQTGSSIYPAAQNLMLRRHCPGYRDGHHDVPHETGSGGEGPAGHTGRLRHRLHDCDGLPCRGRAIRGSGAQACLRGHALRIVE